MRRPIAFISYRRTEAFVGADPEDSPFLRALSAALERLGFDCFIDFSAMHGGADFEAQILGVIEDCDLFIPLIGPRWAEEFKGRKASGLEDWAGLEVHIALECETVILPLRVDGAQWLDPKELPPELLKLTGRHAISLRSRSSSEDIAAQLRREVTRLKPLIRFGLTWPAVYFAIAGLAYFFTAFLPNLVGWIEFGPAWLDMAFTWGGLFVWPVLIFPFSLLALELPIRDALRSAIGASRLRDRLRFSSPFVAALLLTTVGVPVEMFGKVQSPWSVTVRLNPQLTHLDCGLATPYADERLIDVVSYDKSGTMRRRMSEGLQVAPIWLEDKCWPGAFFYLTIPPGKFLGDPDERFKAQQAFIAALTTEDHSRRHVPYSYTFYAYGPSFAILALFGLLGTTIAILLALFRLHRGLDGATLEYQSNYAWIGLTYAFMTLITWVPFRMLTVLRKALYYCAHLAECRVKPDDFYTDLIIGGLLLLGYLALTIGLLRYTKQYRVGLLGLAYVLVVLLVSLAIFFAGERIVANTGLWQLGLGILLFAFMALFALWLQFNPSMLRSEEVRRRVGLASRSPRGSS